MSPAALPRLRAGPRAWLYAAAILGLLLAAAPGDQVPSSLRAAGAACAAGAAALLARRSAPPAAGRLALVARQALGREAGVALLLVDGRPLLVGYGPAGVRSLRPGPAAAAPTVAPLEPPP